MTKVVAAAGLSAAVLMLLPFAPAGPLTESSSPAARPGSSALCRALYARDSDSHGELGACLSATVQQKGPGP
jgi:hypothetical protein